MVEAGRLASERPGLADLGARGASARGCDDRIRQIEEAALEFEVPFYETDVGKSSVKALLTAGAPRRARVTTRSECSGRSVGSWSSPEWFPSEFGVNTGKVFTGDFGIAVPARLSRVR